MSVLYSVILAGGAGSRLWPLSREMYPKQIFKLDNDKETLFIKTFLRLASVTDDKNIITTTNVKHASAIKTQLNKMKEKFCRNNDYTMITEPVSRNTAPSITLAVKHIEDINKSSSESPVIIVSPCDHIIENRELFANLIEKGINLAKEGYIVSFGTETESINENYGYLKARKNPKISEIEIDALKAVNFIEKAKTKEQKNILRGKIYQNSGIYMFTAETYMNELKKYAPKIYETLYNTKIKTNIPSIDLAIYEKLPEISIDYAVMEKTKKLVTIPFNIRWKDIGSWDAIYELANKDTRGNYFSGKVIDIGSKNSLIYSTSKLLATIGLNDTVVVETEDAILVCGKNNIETGIKNIYKKLNGKNVQAKEIHKTVIRPWGYYTVLENGSGFLTKCITVYPNSKLSLQKHNHRSEHWIVLEGQATIIKGQKKYTLLPGESIDIDVKEIHSLQNLSSEEVKIIEVQQGDILDENDIERLEDIYGRV